MLKLPMINLFLTLTLRLDKISLEFTDSFFSGNFSLADTDPCFELLTLQYQKLLFPKLLFIAPIKLFANLHVQE